VSGRVRAEVRETPANPTLSGEARGAGPMPARDWARISLGPVKEFWTYTALRLLIFAASVAIVFGVWLAVAGSVSIMWALVVGLLLSGVASYFLLARQRAALASHVDARAHRAATRFDEMRAKEDVD
jgi:protein-S-isoprenylcysteine O-methyltransferase Ste14